MKNGSFLESKGQFLGVCYMTELGAVHHMGGPGQKWSVETTYGAFNKRGGTVYCVTSLLLETPRCCVLH